MPSHPHSFLRQYWGCWQLLFQVDFCSQGGRFKAETTARLYTLRGLPTRKMLLWKREDAETSNCRQTLAVSGTTGIFSAASAAPRLMAADYSLQYDERLPETSPSFRFSQSAKFQVACNLVGISFIPVGTLSKHGRHLCTRPAKNGCCLSMATPLYASKRLPENFQVAFPYTIYLPSTLSSHKLQTTLRFPPCLPARGTQFHRLRGL